MSCLNSKTNPFLRAVGLYRLKKGLCVGVLLSDADTSAMSYSPSNLPKTPQRPKCFQGLHFLGLSGRLDFLRGSCRTSILGLFGALKLQAPGKPEAPNTKKVPKASELNKNPKLQQSSSASSLYRQGTSLGGNKA